MSAVPEVPQASASGAAGPKATRRPPGRVTIRDLLLVAGGVVLTFLFAYAFARKPLYAAAALLVLAVAAALWLGRGQILRWRVGLLLVAGLILLPFTALMGPVLGLPQVPQAFAFRVLLVVVLYAGVTWLLLVRARLAFGARQAALLAVLWYSWLAIALIWAPDRQAGLRYLLVLLTMLLVLAATATAGATRPRLQALAVVLGFAYLIILGIAVLESVTGFHLPQSRLTTAVTSLTFGVTSVFHNENDLATYMAMCWPFLLLAFLFTRRRLWLLFTALVILATAFVFVRTGSRSSLLAAGLETVVGVAVFWHALPRISTRRAKTIVAAAVVVVIAAAAFLAFNTSQSSMLQQFQLRTLLKQAATGTGSGDIRTNLTRAGFEIAGSSLLLGAGPGQADVIISQGVDALAIPNLHDWWLETYADGGLPGFFLQAAFFVALIALLLPIARHDPDSLVRYLAGGTALALIGFIVGALGPSSSFDFAPMYVLYGLGLAVISRARLAARARQDALMPAPGGAAAAAAREAAVAREAAS